MKALVLFLLSGMSLGGATVELLPDSTASVFGGGQRAMDVVFRNQTEMNVRLSVGLQVLQANSATAVPWSEPRPWRSLALLPRQTSIERVEIDFPVVQAESPFLIRFLSGREVLGLVSVRVYPANILSNLAGSAASTIISSVQPELRQVLVEAGFGVSEAEAPKKSGARPQLSIYGPEFSRKGPAAGISEAMSLAKPGHGVVLILPESHERRTTAPSYYPVRVNEGIVVVVREATLAHLATDPVAQLRLARIIRLALGLESLSLPESDL
jgi:hypothetical protein